MYEAVTENQKNQVQSYKDVTNTIA